jgi:hypothetical protein
VVASLTLAGYVLNVVALKPERPAQVLSSMLSSDRGQQVLAGVFADEIHRRAPSIPEDSARSLAMDLTSNPQVAHVIRRLGRADSPAARQALVDRSLATVARQDPAAAEAAREYLRTVRPLSLLTSTGSPWDSGTVTAMHRALSSLVLVGALLAAGLAAMALLVGPARDQVLRWVGGWGLVAGAVGAFGAFALPTILLHSTSGPLPVLLWAGFDASRHDLLVLFVGLAGGGAVLLLAALAVRSGSPRRY